LVSDASDTRALEVTTNVLSVLGEVASGRVTISNSEIDGTGDYSATCDGHQYWALYFTGYVASTDYNRSESLSYHVFHKPTSAAPTLRFDTKQWHSGFKKLPLGLCVSNLLLVWSKFERVVTFGGSEVTNLRNNGWDWTHQIMY
jgi:hypothetical protein